MSKYITINVEPKHIKEGSPGEADCCAISLALLDSDIVEDRDKVWVRVGGGCDMYKEWITYGGGEDCLSYRRGENPLRVHPNDLAEVQNFIDWFDDQCDYDFLSEASEETLNNHTLTFRVKELF